MTHETQRTYGPCHDRPSSLYFLLSDRQRSTGRVKLPDLYLLATNFTSYVFGRVLPDGTNPHVQHMSGLGSKCFYCYVYRGGRRHVISSVGCPQVSSSFDLNRTIPVHDTVVYNYCLVLFSVARTLRFPTLYFLRDFGDDKPETGSLSGVLCTS